MRPVHVIIPTHTTRHLRLTLLGIAQQSVAPASVTVTCDNDSTEIREHVEDVSAELCLHVTLVQRPHQGRERLAQVRNNAVRALSGRLPQSPGLTKEAIAADPQLLFLDGDCFLERKGVEKHAQLSDSAELVIAFRTDTSEAQLDSFDEAKARRGEMPIVITEAQRQLLNRRHRRYDRQQRMKRVPLLGGLLVKEHKPKLLGGHHSVRLSSYIAVNGHDEEYHTWGTEDDDFCRRVYQSGATSVVAVGDIDCLHLYHPTRSPAEWKDRPNAQRFAQALPMRCAHGLDDPLEQGEIVVCEAGPSRLGAGSR